MRRFFLPPGLLAGREVNLPPQLARRLATVLRLKRGDRLLLADGAGRDYEVELTAISPRSAAAVVVAERPSPPEPSLELVLEKGTELGVSRFVPLLSGRARVRTGSPAGEGGSQRLQRWLRIVTEAAEQSGRGRVPALDSPLPFEEALSSAPRLLLLPWEGERAQGLRSYLRALGDRPQAVSLLIGPEGGFAEDEVRLARDAGSAPVSLGPRILRSETAGIVAAALVMHELGEMGS